MDFEPLGSWFSWVLVPLDDVFWFPHCASRDKRGACQVADLTLMIKATWGRSRRPNHMRSHIGNPKAMRPVNFRRLRGEFHSVAKQASFNIAFGRDFWSFGSDFGRFWEAKTEAKIDFWEVFCDVFFECALASILGGFLEAQNLKNSNFASTGARFLQIWCFQKISEKHWK